MLRSISRKKNLEQVLGFQQKWDIYEVILHGLRLHRPDCIRKPLLRVSSQNLIKRFHKHTMKVSDPVSADRTPPDTGASNIAGVLQPPINKLTISHSPKRMVINCKLNLIIAEYVCTSFYKDGSSRITDTYLKTIL